MPTYTVLYWKYVAEEWDCRFFELDINNSRQLQMYMQSVEVSLLNGAQVHKPVNKIEVVSAFFYLPFNFFLIFCMFIKLDIMDAELLHNFGVKFQRLFIISHVKVQNCSGIVTYVSVPRWSCQGIKKRFRKPKNKRKSRYFVEKLRKL